MTARGEPIDFRQHLERVARLYWGEPTPHLSRPGQLRFGAHGSKAANLNDGTWFDHEAGVGGGVLDLIVCIENCTRAEAARRLEGDLGETMISYAPKSSPRRPDPGDEDHRRSALAIWGETHAFDSKGSLIPAYLALRGIELPPGCEAVRWHRKSPFGPGHTTPAMVCEVVDIITNRPLGIQRTAIGADGRKAVVGGVSKLSLGPTKGGCVKLSPDSDVEGFLGLGEGVETALSIRRHPSFCATPVWATCGTAGLRSFLVLAGLGGLVVAVDGDQGGVLAAEAVAARWAAAGKAVTRLEPPAGYDLNDLAMWDQHHG